MADDTITFRYDDMQRHRGDSIEAEDWNKAMQAIAQLAASAGSAGPKGDRGEAGPPGPNGDAGSDWMRTPPAIPSPVSFINFLSLDSSNLIAIAVDSAFAYVAGAGLQVYTLSSIFAQAPVLQGSVDCPGALDIFLAGDYAYLAAGADGLVIVNIADRTAPSVTVTLPLSGTARRLCVVDDLAYVVSYEQGLQIVNVADRRNPVLLGQIDAARPNAVVVRDRVAYIASEDSGYCVIDVAKPAAPAYRVRSAANFETGKDICLYSVWAYVFDEPHQVIRFLEMTQPTAWTETFSVAVDPPCHNPRMIVRGDTLLMISSSGDAGLYICDLTAHGQPSLIPAVGSRPALGMAADDQYVYFGGPQVLQVFDLWPPALTLPSGSVGIGVSYPQARLEVRGGLTLLEQEPWRDVSLPAGLLPYGGDYNPVQCFIDSQGIVHLRGMIKSASGRPISTGTTFSLPPRYGPQNHEVHLVLTFQPAVSGSAPADGWGRVDIHPNGSVSLMTPGQLAFSLDGISYRAQG